MKTKDILILLFIAAVGYFLYKKYIPENGKPLSSIPVTLSGGNTGSVKPYSDSQIFPNVNTSAPISKLSTAPSPVKRRGNKQELIQKLKGL